MGSENFNVLEELKSLDQQIGIADELAALKPIFYRLDAIAREYTDDFEVQLSVGDVKQHLVTRGAWLKERRDRSPEFQNLPTTMTMAAPPPETSSEPPPVAPVQLPTSPFPVPPVPAVPPDKPFLAAPAAPPIPPGGPPSLPFIPAPSQAAPGPPRPPAPPQAPSNRPPMDWKRAVWMGVLGGLVFMAVFVLMVNLARKRNPKPAADAAEVAVDIVTTPPGASVRVNSETKCTSPCKFSLPPGNYQITAFLDGYEPFGSGVTLAAGEPKALNLPLEPQAESVRILTDFDKGKVALDDQPPVDLQEGQYVFEKVPAGPHTVKVTSANREASFSFDLADAKLPSITGTVAAKNVLAVLVASFANQAHVVTGAGGPWKLAVNGQQEADAGPAGVDLKTFQAGVDELIIGDGKQTYNVKESFGPAPMVTAKILTPDQNTGTLIVATEENDVTVFVNNQQQRSRTARGQLRVSTLGPVTVRVSKKGFEDQTAKTEVKKGEEARLEFKMKPTAMFATLDVVGAPAGTEVRIDQKPLGTAGSDGGFRNTSVVPGSHTIELAHPQFVTRSFTRTFAAGETVTLSGLDVLLAAEKPPAPPPPPEAPKPAPPPPKALPPPVAPPKTVSMEGFDDPSQWKEEAGVFRHHGSGFFPYKVPANGGVLTFNVYLIRGGGLLGHARLRWRVNYVDEKNYTQFELDDDTLYSRDMVKGKASPERKLKHNIPSKDKKDKVWAIKIDLSPDKVVHMIQKDQDWVRIDTFAPEGRNLLEGKFGFYLQGGGDEMGLSDLTLQAALVWRLRNTPSKY